MEFPKTNLDIYLTFVDELKQIQIQVSIGQNEFKLQNMGIVQGRESLRDLLQTLTVDFSIEQHPHYGFSSIAVNGNPQSIVERMEKTFEIYHGIDRKIKNGESVTDEEYHLMPFKWMRVYSSSVKTEKGLELIQSWFDARKVSNPSAP